MWWLPWLAAMALFLILEGIHWQAGAEAGLPSLWRWFVAGDLDALTNLVLLITAPLVWWSGRRFRSTQSPNPRRVTATLAGCLGLTGAATAGSPARPIVYSLVVGAISLVVSSRTGARFDDLPPAYHDEYSYRLQAETFLAGRVSFPSHAAPRLFDQTHVLNEGRFVSRYFPGAGLWMAPFVAAGHPYWGHWLASALCCVLMVWIGRELAGDCSGLIAGLLTALSPGMALFSNLLVAHQPTLVGLALFLLGFFRMLSSGSFGWSLVAGVGLAFAMLCRPMTAAGVALPFGLWYLAQLVRGQMIGEKHRLPPAPADVSGAPSAPPAAPRLAIGLGLPIVAALVGLFFYDQAITGNGWVTPYSLYTDLHTPSHVYGFNNVERGRKHQGPRVIENYDRWAENLTPGLALQNARTRLSASWKWTLGLIPLTLALVGGLVLWRQLPSSIWLILAGIVSLHLVHIPYWFVGMEDHHYVFEAGPLWMLWTGVVTVTAVRCWANSGQRTIGRWWGSLLASAVALNFCVSGGLWSAPYEQGVNRVAFARQKHARFADLVSHRALPHPTLVLVESDPADRHIDYVTNTPDLAGPVLIGNYIPDLVSLDRLKELFPDRSLFLYRVRKNEWRPLD
jgi:hypothetical protein